MEGREGWGGRKVMGWEERGVVRGKGWDGKEEVGCEERD